MGVVFTVAIEEGLGELGEENASALLALMEDVVNGVSLSVDFTEYEDMDYEPEEEEEETEVVEDDFEIAPILLAAEFMAERRKEEEK